MGHLAFIGSHRVNGVSALHTELMRRTVFKDLHGLYPDRIVNKTNGITFRRWLHQANPGLTGCSPRPWRRACSTTRRRSANSRLSPRTPRSATVRRRQARRTRARWRALIARRGSASASTRGAVRRADQAHPRIQAPAPEHPRDGRALRRDPRQPDARLGAARQDLRRQGGGELSPGQAHHQARQRRGAG